MKTHSLLKRKMLVATFIFSILGIISCNNNDDQYYYNPYPNALVTVKQAADDVCFLQLDDSTTLLPINIPSHPYGGKEVRALALLTEVNQTSKPYTKAVEVHQMDSILTKSIAPNLGEKNDSIYGQDPVDILKDWITIAEDGYLTLRFATLWSFSGQKHYINLISTQNPENPYELEFRHNAYGDIQGKYTPSVVAFRLDKLPDTNGKTVKLTLKWKSFKGYKSVQFDYCSRKAVNPNQAAIAEGFNPQIQRFIH